MSQTATKPKGARKFLSLEIPAELHREVKILAAKEDLTIPEAGFLAVCRGLGRVDLFNQVAAPTMAQSA